MRKSLVLYLLIKLFIAEAFRTVMLLKFSLTENSKKIFKVPHLISKNSNIAEDFENF